MQELHSEACSSRWDECWKTGRAVVLVSQRLIER